MLRVALVLAGDELCEGHRADGNGPWMAHELTVRGAFVTGLRACRDDVEPLARAVTDAAADAALVIVSGGLGPTEDDRTREALAIASGKPLVEHTDAFDAITAALSRRGIKPLMNHHRQATVPEGGRWLENVEGVAPGIACRVGDADVLALPGVPAELRAMFALHVLPLLGEGDVEERSAFAAGLGEPAVEQTIREPLEGHDVRVGFYPHHGEVEVRLFARGPGAAERVAAAHAVVVEALGPAAYEPPAGGRIEDVVVATLAARGLTVTTAESVTGGLIAEMLTRVSGSSDVLRAAWVSYGTEAKTRELGVTEALIAEHGVVSEAVAAAMAEGARARAGADAALATTGAAGPGAWQVPDGGEVPAGRVVVALAMAGQETVVKQLQVPASRAVVRRRAAVAALDLLRRGLQQEA
ncbi:MAG: nicotinamide-nucleotide amidohydrolase family protein [Planctomycetota bacterium]|nr:nicotinamide-nucleotide amidohydrolase family protein [Planctomycetota bacterium]